MGVNFLDNSSQYIYQKPTNPIVHYATKNKPGSKIETFFEHLLVLAILLCEYTMYNVSNKFVYTIFSLSNIKAACLILSIVLCFIGFITRKTRILGKNIIKLFAIETFLLLFPLLNTYNILGYFKSFFVPVTVFLVYNCICYEEGKIYKFLKIYTKIAVFLAGMSLFFYFFGAILRLIPSESFLYYNLKRWNVGYSYLNLHFVNPWQTQTIFGFSFARNIGIYMEAPSFAFPLTIGLFFELFYGGKHKKLNSFLLLAAMVTTFSTKALILGAAVCVFYVIFGMKNNQKYLKLLKTLFIPILLAAAIIFIYLMFIEKSAGEDNWSYLRRLDDTQAAFMTWLQNPLFGKGYDNYIAVYNNFLYSSHEGGLTAGLFNILAFGGIYLFVLYVYSWINLYNSKKKTDRIFILGFIILFVTFLFMSSIQYSYFTMFLLALCLMA